MPKKLHTSSTFGAYGKNHARTVGPCVDFDYLAVLPPAAKRWLAKFAEEYYGGWFPNAKPLHRSRAAQRLLYRAKNAANRDAFAVATARDQLDYDVPPRAANECDQAQTPAYLNTVEYKQRLAAFRAEPQTKPMRGEVDKVIMSQKIPQRPRRGRKK